LKPFDPSTYLKEVLGPYLDSTELPSLFERYCLEPADNDDQAIHARCREIKQLWDMRVERAKYGPLIRLLLERHSEALLTLEDPDERRRAAAAASQAEASRAQDAARTRSEWESLLAAAVKQNGGLDPTTRANLERAAATLGVSETLARAQLDRAPVAALQSTLAEDERRELRKALTSLAQDTGEPLRGLSLFHALGLPGVTLDVAEIAARHDEVDAENRKRRRDNTRVLYETVLVRARRLLVDGDPRAYVEALVVDVGEALAAEGMRAAVDDGAIDEAEAEHLSRRAVELGLTPELARRVVAKIAHENAVPLRTGVSIDYVICASCGRVAARDGAPERCQQCGKSLFVSCPEPSCLTVNDASAARCRKCGGDLRQFTTASRKLAGLSELMRAGQLEQAAEDMTVIETVLGATPEVERCGRELAAARQRAQTTWAEVDADLAARRLYAARQRLQELRRTACDMPGPGGQKPHARLVWVGEQLASVEDALRRARISSGSEREAALVEALGGAADCTEAMHELDRMPASPPEGVRAAMSGVDAVVSWQASPTAGVSYEVTRVASDGTREVVASSVADYRAIDVDVASGAVVRYEVTAVRGKARSPFVASPPLVVARELQDIAVFDGDSEVRLSWRPVGPRGRVIVVRRHDRSGAEQKLDADSAGVLDRSVENGERYSYRVRVEYTGPNGESVLTGGGRVFARPSPAPEPVAIEAAQRVGAGVLFTVPSPATGRVSVIRCDTEPMFSVGDRVDAEELSRIGVVLANEADGARDPDAGAGMRWYLPVTLAGTMAVVGPSYRYLALPAVSNVRARYDGDVVLVTWSWPDGLKTVMVAWRANRQPAGPTDPDAQARPFRRSEYRDRGGFAIEAPGLESVFVAVYPAARVGNEVLYESASTPATRAAVTRMLKTDVRYTVRRSGMRRKKLEIDVQAPAGDELPEMIVIARQGDLVPREPGDGEIVAHLGGSGPLQSTLDLANLARPVAVRVFLAATDTRESSHRLVDPSVEDLVIR
jgi:hypothetical protein